MSIYYFFLFVLLQPLDSAQLNLVAEALQRSEIPSSSGRADSEAASSSSSPEVLAPTAEMLRKHGKDMIVTDPKTKTRIIYRVSRWRHFHYL